MVGAIARATPEIRLWRCWVRAGRDRGVEVRGPAAASLRSAFYEVWRRFGGPTPGSARATTGQGDQRVRVLTNGIVPRPGRSIVRAYLTAIRRATTSIDIASAYF